MDELKGKVAVITGAGQGVGLGIAQAFAAAGADLVITGRTKDKLQAAVPQLQSLGARVAVCPGDCSTRAAAQDAVTCALDHFGGLHILVNNAQSSVPGLTLEQSTDEHIQLILGSGLLGTLYHMQAALPALRAKGGSIINFGSKEGIHGGIGFGIYAAAKEGIRGLSRVAAREWGPHNIRVNVICPAALSPAATAYLDANPELAAGYLRDIPLGRFGDLRRDIAPLALFLASEESRYISGQTINADGGMVML